MDHPKLPKNELERLEAVYRTGLLDTPAESDFDNITSLVSTITEAPICLITLLDSERNFLKSHHGVPFSESPRDISFCGHAINEDKPIMVVNDAREDTRFHDNPLVTDFNAIFYAGVPLKSVDGYKLGTLCIFDHLPRVLDEAIEATLLTLANQVEKLYELRLLANNLSKSHTALHKAHTRLLEHHTELSDFSRIMAHDIKTPVSSLAFFGHMLADELPDTTDTETLAIVEKITTSSQALCHYIDDLLETKLHDKRFSNEPVALTTLMDELLALTVLPPNSKLILPESNTQIVIDRLALIQVLLNLITNAIKYNDKPVIHIEITYVGNALSHRFEVVDNGMGIEESKVHTIFERNKQTDQIDRYGKKGSGTGLATLKAILEDLDGDIKCKSTVGKGSTFTVTIPQNKPCVIAA